jgi:TRAP-type transport system periplasmic protein
MPAERAPALESKIGQGRVLMLGTLRACALATAVLFAGAGATSASPTVTLRFGSYAPEGDVIDRAAHHFKERVVALTNGRVDVTVFRSNALGSNREMIEMTKVGSLDLTVSGSTHVSRFAPVLITVSLPSLFKDRDTMLKILDGEIGGRINASVARQGLQVLGWWETGFRHVSNNKRPIMKPDDIKGLKLRTLPSAVHVAYFRALGAIPTPMDWAEVMPALQQGVIDGQENPPSVVYPYRVFEFQKFYSLTSHVNEPNLLLISAATMTKLPKDVQDAILTAGREATAFQRKASAEYNSSIMGELAKVMSVNEVPAETLAHFQTVAQSVYERAYADIGAEGRAIVDDIVKASK